MHESIFRSKNTSISEFEFEQFDDRKGPKHVIEYHIPKLEDIIKDDKTGEVKQIWKEIETSKNNLFRISPVTKKFRGIYKQEKEHFEKRVSEAVEARLRLLSDEAREQGRLEGIELGRKEIIEKTIKDSDEKIKILEDLLKNTLETKDEIYRAQRKEIYELVKSLTKWVILRELKDDEGYLERLLEKLILELNVRSNLLIKINEKYVKRMPEVIQNIESRLGNFSNVRVEVLGLKDEEGILIESENGMIDATLSTQLDGINKIFKKLDDYEE